MKFSIKDFFSKVTKSAGNCGFGHFTEEFLNGKLHFVCSERCTLTSSLKFESAIFVFAKGMVLLRAFDNGTILARALTFGLWYISCAITRASLNTHLKHPKIFYITYILHLKMSFRCAL